MDFDHQQPTASYSQSNPTSVQSASPSSLLSSPKTKESDSPSELNQYAKQKLNELYLYWIGKKESQNLMYEYTESFSESISSPIQQSTLSSTSNSLNNMEPVSSSNISSISNPNSPNRSPNQSLMDYKLSEVNSFHLANTIPFTHMKSQEQLSQSLGNENNRFSSSDPMTIQPHNKSPPKPSNGTSHKTSSPKMFTSHNRPSKTPVIVDEVDFSSKQHKLSHESHHHHSHTHPINSQNETTFTTVLGSDHLGNAVSISNSLQNITPHSFSNLSTGSSTPPKSPIHSPTRTIKPPNPESEIGLHHSSNSIRKKLNFSEEFDDTTQLKAGILQRKLQELQNVAINYESQKKKMKMTVDSASFSKIPRFYFPNEKPTTTSKVKEDFIKIKQFFLGYPLGVTMEQFGKLVTEVCGLPFFFRNHLFARVDEFNMGTITCEMFEDYWKHYMQYDNETLKFFNVIKQKVNDHICPSDFKLIMREILAYHPGLRFLESTPDFQEKYAETVIIRIFYSLTKSSSIGKIYLREFKNSNIVETFKLLEREQDTNNEINYFAYEHFYVLFCKFWELDTDRDGMLSKDDLMLYGDSCLTEFIVDRIMKGYGKKLTGKSPNMMSYEDFVWFCLSEEDKTTPVAQEYWFRCVDIDGDGVLSLYELEQVFSEQKERIKQYDPEILFSDIHCQIIDMLKPKNRDVITLADIKKSKMSPIFFNILFNLTKFFVFEQRGTLGTNNVWAQYAKEEYQRLINEDEDDMQVVDMVDEELEDDVVIN